MPYIGIVATINFSSKIFGSCEVGDEELARSIITGTFDIPAYSDHATTLILKEIGKMDLKIMNGEGNKIIITPEEFTHFWKRVGEFTSSSSSGVYYGHYKAAIQDQMSTKVLTLPDGHCAQRSATRDLECRSPGNA